MDASESFPDTSYTASSQYNNLWLPKMMSLREPQFGWIPAESDVNAWIKIDMLRVYSITGLFLQHASDYHLLTYNIKYAVNESNYEYVATSIEAEYIETYTLYWFNHSASGRYWIIEPLTGSAFRAVKGEFIGRIET